ncbi:MAG TPA: glycosyltransferase [Mycobacteriales bacterium]|nr:glycosyltransferase [Mycobacteriales bacterium]
MSRPTVLHCARDFARPSETFVVDVVRCARRVRPVVACEHRWGEVAAVQQVSAPVRELGRVVRDPQHPSGRRALRALLAGVAVADRAAVLHAHFGYWAGHVARVAGWLRRPWVLSLHGHDLLVEDAGHPDRDALRAADVVVVPSQFLAVAACAAGFLDDRIKVLPPGIDLDAIAFRARSAPELPSGAVTVTFAGRYVAKKGGADALDAIAAVRPDVPLRAVFVGFGPLEDELRQRAADLRVPVEWRRGDEPGAVRTALARTDLLLMPSRTAPDGDAESLGLVAVEAQAAGVPVVATAHGGLPEAVHPQAGVLVPEGDPAALATALADLATGSQRWPAMGAAGRAHVQRQFSLADRMAELEELYLRLADREVSGR